MRDGFEQRFVHTVTFVQLESELADVGNQFAQALIGLRKMRVRLFVIERKYNIFVHAYATGYSYRVHPDNSPHETRRAFFRSSNPASSANDPRDSRSTHGLSRDSGSAEFGTVAELVECGIFAFLFGLTNRSAGPQLEQKILSAR